MPGANYSKIYPFALKNLILYGSWLRPDDMYSRPILPLDTSALVSVILTPPEGPDSDSDIVNGRQVLPSLFARPAPRLRIVQNVISTDLERPWFIKALQTWSSLDRLHIIIAEAGDNVVHSLLRSLRSIPSSSLPLLSALDLSFEEQVIPFLLLSPLLTMPFAKGLRLLDLHGPSADEHPIVSKAEEEGANELRKVGRGRRIEVWVEERSGQPLEDEDEDEDEHA